MVDSIKYEILPYDFPDFFDLSYIVIFIGDTGVGKSKYLQKSIKGIYDEFYSPTDGFESFTFNIKLEDKIIKLELKDTCGKELNKSLITPFYRKANLIVISYAIDNKKSFEHISNWLNEAKLECDNKCKFFLIGNKADLEKEREILKEEGEKFAKENNFVFFAESSAKSGLNIQDILIQASKILYSPFLEEEKNERKKEIKRRITITEEKFLKKLKKDFKHKLIKFYKY